MALISFAVTAKLICVFVFAYAKSRFSHDAAHISVGSLEKHGSIITHLLSQVRIGMDLTKVVLPTFILERKSLLEMYADFLAHCDLFVK